MHVRLRRVVPQHTVDDDGLLAACATSVRRPIGKVISIATYRSVNHPFGLYQALVCVGLGGIM